MYNPLVTGIAELNDDELLAKINELNSKMGQASSAGMFNAISQMVVILNEYQDEMDRRHRKAMEEGAEKFDELIDVNKNK